jgi:hypothetical protein
MRVFSGANSEKKFSHLSNVCLLFEFVILLAFSQFQDLSLFVLIECRKRNYLYFGFNFCYTDVFFIHE